MVASKKEQVLSFICSLLLASLIRLHSQESTDVEAPEGGGLRRKRTIKKKKRVSCCFISWRNIQRLFRLQQEEEPKHISVGWCRFVQTPSPHGFKGAIYKIQLIRLQEKQILICSWTSDRMTYRVESVVTRPLCVFFSSLLFTRQAGRLFKYMYSNLPFLPPFRTSGPFSSSHHTNKQQRTDDANDNIACKIIA